MPLRPPPLFHYSLGRRDEGDPLQCLKKGSEFLDPGSRRLLVEGGDPFGIEVPHPADRTGSPAAASLDDLQLVPDKDLEVWKAGEDRPGKIQIPPALFQPDYGVGKFCPERVDDGQGDGDSGQLGIVVQEKGQFRIGGPFDDRLVIGDHPLFRHMFIVAGRGCEKGGAAML